MASPVNSLTPFGKRKVHRPKAKIYSILDSLTERDIQICLALYEFRVLTTHQIFEFFFSTPTRARKRLIQLYRRGVIARFRPPARPGSHPQHYVLDELGAKIVAGYMGVELKKLAFRKDRVLDWAKSQRLGHLRDTNDFFSRLAWRCQRSNDHVLQLAEGEMSAAYRAFSRTELTRPDGFGIIDGPSGRCNFLLELDRGTETIERVTEKLGHYDMVGYKKDPPWALLFCVHSERREANLQRGLYRMDGLAIATTTLDRHLRDPLGTNWLPVGEHVRYSLPEVPRRGIPHPQAHEDDPILGGIIHE